MISQHLADVLSAVLGIGFLILAFSLAGLFHLKTVIIVRKIRIAYRDEGISWQFWRNTEALVNFALMPDKMINQSDSVRVAEEKRILLNHRKSLWRTMYWSWALMGAAFLSVVAIQSLTN